MYVHVRVSVCLLQFPRTAGQRSGSHTDTGHRCPARPHARLRAGDLPREGATGRRRPPGKMEKATSESIFQAE